MKNRIGLLVVFGKRSLLPFSVFMLFVLTTATGQQTMNLNPIEDGYIQGNNGVRNEVLYVQNGSGSSDRRSYLLFDLNNVPGTITALELILKVHHDSGTAGTVEIHKSNDDTWDEQGLSSANRPSQNGLIGSLTPPFGTGTIKTLDIPEGNITAGMRLSLVLVRTGSSSDDMAFASNGPDIPSAYFAYAPLSQRPTLKVTYDTTPTDTPPVINSFTGTPTSDSQIDLNWSASDDNGVTGYALTMNGVTQSLSSTTATSFSATGLSANTNYDFQLTASDGGGNSTNSAVLPITTQSSGSTGSGGYWNQTGSDISYTTGNVGIGTTNIGDWKLAIGGKIRAEEIKVETGWADYVFFNNYNLPTLKEVEQHIHEKGHLINIPSAAEVEANGIELGEMNKLLLEKIEELTLYILQQEKRIKAIEAQK